MTGVTNMWLGRPFACILRPRVGFVGHSPKGKMWHHTTNNIIVSGSRPLWLTLWAYLDAITNIPELNIFTLALLSIKRALQGAATSYSYIDCVAKRAGKIKVMATLWAIEDCSYISKRYIRGFYREGRAFWCEAYQDSGIGVMCLIIVAGLSCAKRCVWSTIIQVNRKRKFLGPRSYSYRARVPSAEQPWGSRRLTVS